MSIQKVEKEMQVKQGALDKLNNRENQTNSISR